jgi:hypothetical protein
MSTQKSFNNDNDDDAHQADEGLPQGQSQHGLGLDELRKLVCEQANDIRQLKEEAKEIQQLKDQAKEIQELKDQVAILGKAIEIQDHDEGNRFQEMVVKHERMLND